MKTNRHESFFDSSTTWRMFRSGWGLLQARRIRTVEQLRQRRFYPRDFLTWFIYVMLIIVPGIFLEIFQQIHYLFTGKTRNHPEGSWQYYLDSGLREDTAHHTNETIGYFRDRPQVASDLDDLTAWVMAMIQIIWNYEDILGVLWDEWVLLSLMSDAALEDGKATSETFIRLQRQWELKRPYDAPLNGSYADVRRGAFDAFVKEKTALLSNQTQTRLQFRYSERVKKDKAKFQHQLSILRTITPGRFIDSREDINLCDAHIAIVYKGIYALLPVAARNVKGDITVVTPTGTIPLMSGGAGLKTQTGESLVIKRDQVFLEKDGTLFGYLDLAPVATIKAQLQRIMSLSPKSQRSRPSDRFTPVDILLAETPRKSQRKLRALLPNETRQEIDALRTAPIIINWETRDASLPLSEIRRTNRGIGDHALTILRTDDSIIFDQSHIFFDGTWSLAIAEILTSSAVNWCKRVFTITPGQTEEPKILALISSDIFRSEAAMLQEVPEISSETTIFDISQIFKLRDMLGERYKTALTVNDLLVTARILHAVNYQPSSQAVEAIEEFHNSRAGSADRRAYRLIKRSLSRGRQTNPALLIPVDASPTNPADRIYPITFRIPSDDLIWKWDASWEAYQAYRRHDPPDTPEALKSFRDFDARRQEFVNELTEYSKVLDASKAVALRADSFNLAILELMTHLHPGIQNAIKGIAELFPLVNELARGDEVYSNVGRVAHGSSITRFMSAKDDGATKYHVWGIMTDNQGQMVITMRDFRPHVAALHRAGRDDIAAILAHDYVVNYTNTLIGLVARLWAMLQADSPVI